MSDDPRTWRRWARILSSLVQTPPDELEAFARERASDLAGIGAAELSHARNLLLHVGASLHDPGRRDGIRHAVEFLDNWEQGRNTPVSKPSPSAPSPSTPSPSAPSPSAPSPSVPTPSRDPLPAFARTPRPMQSSPWSPAPANLKTPLQTTAAPNPSGGPALPFKGKRSEPPAPLEHSPSPAFGQTVGYSGGERPRTMPFAAVPASGPSSEPLPMALERYAMLCIERSLWPDHLAQTRTRYGLDEAGEQDIDRRFKDHFAAQPSARQRWLRLCAAYRAQLEGSKPVA